MAQQHKISKNNTRIVTEGDTRMVCLHSTPIVKVTPDTIYLNTGGWLTTTTMTRMNQVASEWDLGFRVSRRGGKFRIWIDGQEYYTDDNTYMIVRKS